MLFQAGTRRDRLWKVVAHLGMAGRRGSASFIKREKRRQGQRTALLQEGGIVSRRERNCGLGVKKRNRPSRQRMLLLLEGKKRAGGGEGRTTKRGRVQLRSEPLEPRRMRASVWRGGGPDGKMVESAPRKLNKALTSSRLRPVEHRPGRGKCRGEGSPG